MNRQELNEWIEKAEPHHWTEEYDSMSNHHESIIYSYNGQDFVLYFCNGEPSERWIDCKGYDRGTYEPRPVTLKKRTVVIEEWFTEDGHNIDFFMG